MSQLPTLLMAINIKDTSLHYMGSFSFSGVKGQYRFNSDTDYNNQIQFDFNWR